MKLQDKITVITGAGKGIGRAAALAAAREGATIVAVARTQADLDETVAMIQADGGRAISLSRDLTCGEEVRSLVDTVLEKFGRIDILVNNAGGYPKEIYEGREHQAIRLWEWSEGQWDQIIRTNLRIPFLCMKHILPVMIRQGSGKVVSVSSRMGRIASQMGAYAVAKGGIVTMTKTAAIQTQKRGRSNEPERPSELFRNPCGASHRVRLLAVLLQIRGSRHRLLHPRGRSARRVLSCLAPPDLALPRAGRGGGSGGFLAGVCVL